MYFTKEDILKIQLALSLLGVKDSELQETSLPKWNDYITIVQDNKNKKVSVQKFLNLFVNESFINLTAKYDIAYVSIKEAIKDIPITLRKKGLLISFIDTNKEWKLYQFKGELNLFNNYTLWDDVFNLEKYVVNSLLPDEEDITLTDKDSNGNGKLKFKDKKYNPSTFSGMGHKILRKNIVRRVNDDGTIDLINYLSADEFSDSNTIYEIKYDFDLNGKEILLLNNCILNFNGGTIANGKIIGNSTNIIASTVKILDNILIEGTFNVDRAYPEWFGAKTTNDDTLAILLCFNLNCGEVYFSNGEYKISNTITSRGSNAIFNGKVTIKAIEEMDYMFIFDFSKENINIENLEKHKYCKGFNTLLDCNNLAKSAIAVKYCLYFNVSGFLIKNATRYSLIALYYDYQTLESINIAGNVLYNYIHILNTVNDNNRVGLLANRQDSVYENITIVNFNTYVKVLKGSKFNNIHCWAYIPEIVPESVAFLVETYDYVSYVNCEADTVMYYLSYLKNYTLNCIVSPYHYTNTDIYDGDLYFSKYGDTKGHLNIILGGFLRCKRLIAEDNKQLELLLNQCIDTSGVFSQASIMSKPTYDLSGKYDELGKDGLLAIIAGELAYKYNNKWLYTKNSDYATIQYGNYDQKPSGIKNGYIYVDGFKNRIIFYKDGNWYTADGYNANNLKEGTTFPVSDTKTGMLFYKTDEERWYYLSQAVGWNKVVTIAKNIQLYNNYDNVLTQKELYTEQNFVHCPDKHKILFYINGEFIDSLGFKGEYATKGTTEQRPTLTTDDKGFLYYDTSLKKPYWWDGEKWVSFVVEDTTYLTKGTTELRPILTLSNEGFLYYDTTLHKPIWWNGTLWIDGTNTPV